MPGFREIPEPNYDKDVNRLLRYYKSAFTRITWELQTVKNGIDQSQGESLLRQITFILGELDNNSLDWCKETVNRRYNNARAATLLSLGEAKSLSEAAKGVSFSLLARNTAENLVNDTYDDLLLATKNTEKKIKQLVKGAVSETMRMRALEQQGRKTMQRSIAATLGMQFRGISQDTGKLTGIVDAAGRRWKVGTYAEMVVRTKLQQAHIEGVRVECLERNVDLAVISSHGAKDGCRRFEGLIISLNGVTPGFPTYAEIRATNQIFHPNCQHSVNPVRDLSLLPQSVRDKATEALKEAEKVLGTNFGDKPVPVPKPKKPRKPRQPKAKPGPVIPTWADQKTIKEIEDYASKLYPNIRWDFEDCDVKAINPSMAEFVRLANKYPGFEKRLVYVGSHKTPKSPIYPYIWDNRVRAHAAVNGKYVGLNPDFYGDARVLKASMETSVAQGWHPIGCDKLETTMTHELGHQVWNYILKEYTEKSLTKVVGNKGLGEGRDLLLSFQRYNNPGISLSRYADTEPAEAWAEGFAALESNPDFNHFYVQNQKRLLDLVYNSKWYSYNGNDGWKYEFLASDDEKKAAADFNKKLLELYKNDLGITKNY
jgi:hypothetical protein